jgi:hypothetical protein
MPGRGNCGLPSALLARESGRIGRTMRDNSSRRCTTDSQRVSTGFAFRELDASIAAISSRWIRELRLLVEVAKRGPFMTPARGRSPRVRRSRRRSEEFSCEGFFAQIGHRGSVLLDAIWLFLTPKTIRVRVEEISTSYKCQEISRDLGVRTARPAQAPVLTRGQSKCPSNSSDLKLQFASRAFVQAPLMKVAQTTWH